MNEVIPYIFQVKRPRKRGAPLVGFKMRKAGAAHKARFLGSALYLMKLSMLGNNLHPGMVTPRMQREIDEIAEYIALFHGPLFLQSRIAAYAPRLDLNLWQNMLIYEVNSNLSCM